MAQKTITAEIDGQVRKITADIPDDATPEELTQAVRAHMAQQVNKPAPIPGMEKLGGQPPPISNRPPLPGALNENRESSGTPARPSYGGGMSSPADIYRVPGFAEGVNKLTRSIPAFSNDPKRGLNDAIEGIGQVSAPAVLPIAMAAAPIPTAVGIGGSFLGAKAGQAATAALGGDEESQRLGGNLGAIAGGYLGGRAGNAAIKVKKAATEYTSEPEFKAALKDETIKRIPIVGRGISRGMKEVEAKRAASTKGIPFDSENNTAVGKAEQAPSGPLPGGPINPTSTTKFMKFKPVTPEPQLPNTAVHELDPKFAPEPYVPQPKAPASPDISRSSNLNALDADFYPRRVEMPPPTPRAPVKPDISRSSNLNALDAEFFPKKTEPTAPAPKVTAKPDISRSSNLKALDPEFNPKPQPIKPETPTKPDISNSLNLGSFDPKFSPKPEMPAPPPRSTTVERVGARKLADEDLQYGPQGTPTKESVSTAQAKAARTAWGKSAGSNAVASGKSLEDIQKMTPTEWDAIADDLGLNPSSPGKIERAIEHATSVWSKRQAKSEGVQ